MKKLKVLAILMVGLFLMSFTASATGSRAEFKEYSISAVDDLYMGKSVKAIWTLSYSNNETPVTVVKRNTLEGTEYVVHSKYFAVSYVSSTNGFGVREVRNSWSDVPKKITRAVVSQEEMKNQEIITPNKVDDEKALGLIASYLPDLVNDGYTHVLN
ncbi:MAG: hypothetical protein ABFS16_06170 [Bacteroidota bacterium]